MNWEEELLLIIRIMAFLSVVIRCAFHPAPLPAPFYLLLPRHQRPAALRLAVLERWPLPAREGGLGDLRAELPAVPPQNDEAHEDVLAACPGSLDEGTVQRLSREGPRPRRPRRQRRRVARQLLEAGLQLDVVHRLRPAVRVCRHAKTNGVRAGLARARGRGDGKTLAGVYLLR